MKITKYLHSCLVFEQSDFKLLFDPGTFSFAEGTVTPEMFKDVDAVIITHKHPDHIDPENLKKIIDISGAALYTNSEVAAEIQKIGMNAELIEEGNYTVGPFKLRAIPVVHEPLLDNPTPQMTAFVINGKVLHPVDSFEEKLLEYKGIELVILPTMAPFTTELKIADFADRLQPKRILPVHDGFAKDFFLKQRYENYTKHFKQKGIEFINIKPLGDSVEV
ncbi:MBL fold metallo-hydrolase [Mucilaginibacter sp. R11]|uniref:MBL fold metallo-hydrolase n=2 Tax=Mucilaginibacter agri TaxID=2695265 RepID=A0A965ZGU0_9SPHI|nr:MBL fold metallo-hydrolase [Mucilaginibacter agri]